MTDTGFSWFGSQYLNRSHEHALMPAGGGYFTSNNNKHNQLLLSFDLSATDECKNNFTHILSARVGGWSCFDIGR